jgi:transposase
LQPGDIVILDNLSSHKVSGVEKAIRATGATLLYLRLCCAEHKRKYV